MADVVDDPPSVMIIRHGEKPGAGKPHGVTADGKHDSDSLTVPGWVRAGGLIELLGATSRAPQAGLRRPDRIYGADPRGGQSKRSIQTVSPLAARLGIEVDTRYQEGDEVHLAEEIRELSGTTLVCWHHEAIHRIADHLGPVIPDPPHSWPEDRFDLVWTFTRTATSWKFAQVPQLLLPDDLPDPIT
jgi:broad specificity phosphatase PhoE